MGEILQSEPLTGSQATKEVSLILIYTFAMLVSDKRAGLYIILAESSLNPSSQSS